MTAKQDELVDPNKRWTLWLVKRRDGYGIRIQRKHPNIGTTRHNLSIASAQQLADRLQDLIDRQEQLTMEAQ